MKMKKQFIFLLSFVLFFAVQSITAQKISVNGMVVDKTGLPIAGVNIVEKDTENSVSSGFDGKFAIKVSKGDAVLVASYIGFTKRNVYLDGKTEVKVTLQEEASNLQEVVVVGYGTQKKKDLTGAIVTANLKMSAEAPNTNILQALQGSMPGVVIGQTNQAGADPTIQIRGRNSLSGNTGVLIVLDGAIYRGQLTDINPGDIQSVDILKDPSSKAIYGAQASNGIIMVTTKKGKKGSKTTVDYSTFYAVQSPIKRRQVLDRAGFIEASRNFNYKDVGFLAPEYTTPNPTYDYINNSGGSFAPLLIDSYNAGTDYDWYKGGSNNTMYTLDHQVSIKGSSETTTFFVSGGYTEQLGWIINDNYKRTSFRVNFDTKVNSWLTVGTNTFASFSDRSGASPSLAELTIISPLAAPRDTNGVLIVNPTGTALVNPFLQTAQDDLNKQNNISSLVYASIDIPKVKGLNFRVNYSNNYRWNKFYYSSIYNSGVAEKKDNDTWDTTLDNILTYDRRFGKHGVKATLVYGTNKVQFNSTTAKATVFSDLSLSYNSLEQGIIPFVSSEAWEESFLSQTARVNYDYDGKYFFNASVRRDGYSGFSEQNKFGVFPSFGLGWAINKETFLQDYTKIDQLKLRFSYGVNGNTTSRYSSLNRFSAEAGSQYLFGDNGTTVNGIFPSSLGNPNLVWEQTEGLNLGLDYGFFGNFISGTIDVYRSKTKDLLWNLPLTSITGFTSIRSNVGGLENSGIEATINFSPLRSKDWNWTFGVNFSKNLNEVTSLFGKDLNADGKEDDLVPSGGNGSGGLFIGEPIGTVFMYESDGIYQLNDIIPAGYQPGSYRIKDLNDDGKIDVNDRKIIGHTEPDYQIGITNSLDYKNLSFKFTVNSVQGGIGVNDPWVTAGGQTGVYSTISNNVVNNRYADIDYWTPSNAGAEYNMPGTTTGNIQYSPWKDKSFVRLQDISFAYSFNKELLTKIGFNSMKFYISGKNLLTLTNWDGWDPETSQGLAIPNTNTTNRSKEEVLASSGLPVLKSVSFGLDLSF